MRGIYQTLIRHSAIYGVGQILSRLVSFLLLPIYTSYLRPADYGVMAILDLVSGALAILVGAGMGSAINRYYFEVQSDQERSQVWWTGLTFLGFGGLAIVIPGIFLSDFLGSLTLGPTIERGGFYYALVLPTLWLNVSEVLLADYLRLKKWSGMYVTFSLGRLILNVGINLYFLIVLQLGVTGILLGNMIAGALISVMLLVLVVRNLESYTFNPILAKQLWAFGSPLILTALLSLFMHQADRYLLRLFVDMSEVGIYSLAYTIGQAVNTLFLVPFTMIWNVVLYEIAQQPNARQIYGQVFRYFFYGLSLLMLGVSLFSGQFLHLLVAPDYLSATKIIPIICLAYLFFSLMEHFSVPVKLAKRTRELVPVTFLAALTNLAANLILIPWFGVEGAAWASVATFGVYSLAGLWRYRQIDRYDYPLFNCGVVLFGMICSYVAYQIMGVPKLGSLWAFCIAGAIWLCWALFLLRPLLRYFLVDGRKYVLGLKVNLGKA